MYIAVHLVVAPAHISFVDVRKAVSSIKATFLRKEPMREKKKRGDGELPTSSTYLVPGGGAEPVEGICVQDASTSSRTEDRGLTK